VIKEMTLLIRSECMCVCMELSVFNVLVKYLQLNYFLLRSLGLCSSVMGHSLNISLVQHQYVICHPEISPSKGVP